MNQARVKGHYRNARGKRTWVRPHSRNVKSLGSIHNRLNRNVLKINNGPICWDSTKTGLNLYDENIDAQDNPSRKFDAYLEWMDINKLIEIQKDILWDYAPKRIKEQAFKHYDEQRERPKDFNWNLGISKESMVDIKNGIKNKDKFKSFVLVYGTDGKIENWQEGRNRLEVMKSMGQKKVPVWKMYRRRY